MAASLGGRPIQIRLMDGGHSTSMQEEECFCDGGEGKHLERGVEGVVDAARQVLFVVHVQTQLCSNQIPSLHGLLCALCSFI